ncbi:DUF6339 family protein [Mycobacterium paragordonae]|uniref:DUF6339 family protein n=1 Tax=Mycobacterium paragordonae TaxID=1389713 RepID=UPI0012E294B7|nr:DUF6339 family protein [Mycobacterium paragordonae]
MTDRLYFPRLQRDIARQRLAEFTNMDIGEIAERSDVEFDRAYFYPTAPRGQQATPETIRKFQTTMRQLAKNHGYPTPLGRKEKAAGLFDREVVAAILDVAPLIPAEAGEEGVWSFLSLVAVPDVALWRWPNRRERDDYERILGYPRNVFRRLWWRAFILGSAPDSAGAKVFEDEAVAILERTAIGGNRTVARMVAETQIRRFEDASKRTDLMRDVMKRIRRLHAFISFHSLSSNELKSLIEEAFDNSEAALMGGR